jgi:NAD(P)-dependent dehydrogenase (short-subunit alcohol dehydrogenase family)
MRNSMREHGAARPLGVAVTGGTAGLGLAMARMFLLAGDRVVICGRRPDRLDAALARLRIEAPGGEAHGMACDVSAPGEAQAFVSHAVSKLGIIDRWINNAGTAGRLKRPLWELSPDDIDETCRTNLCGALMLCAEVVRAMLRQPFDGTGPSFHIFNMGFSALGVRSSPTAAPHRASKRAVALVTGFLDAELKKAGVRAIGVHELSPGLVLTDLLLKDAGIRERMLFNAIAETPETVAAALAPRIRAVSGSGGLLRYQPVMLMAARIIAAKFGYRKGRFFDDEGRRRSP